jgi:hypothetical protein
MLPQIWQNAVSPFSAESTKKAGFCVFPRYPASFQSDSGGILRRFGVIVCLGRFRYDAIHNGETFGGF